jgi:hypothetical protein
MLFLPAGIQAGKKSFTGPDRTGPDRNGTERPVAGTGYNSDLDQQRKESKDESNTSN